MVQYRYKHTQVGEPKREWDVFILCLSLDQGQCAIALIFLKPDEVAGYDQRRKKRNGGGERMQRLNMRFK